mmetsp:Transcript_18581/g.25757  ORF Transcript_18581/g.25757 Transcript_18581/m.25757 type:complete len:232 (+) Transcript_18581:64-759(+)
MLMTAQVMEESDPTCSVFGRIMGVLQPQLPLPALAFFLWARQQVEDADWPGDVMPRTDDNIYSRLSLPHASELSKHILRGATSESVKMFLPSLEKLCSRVVFRGENFLCLTAADFLSLVIEVWECEDERFKLELQKMFHTATSTKPPHTAPLSFQQFQTLIHMVEPRVPELALCRMFVFASGHNGVITAHSFQESVRAMGVMPLHTAMDSFPFSGLHPIGVSPSFYEYSLV